MADISQVKVNNTYYNIKDTTARSTLIRKVLYYRNQAVNPANSAEILRIPSSGTDSNITTDTVVLDCNFYRPAYITSRVSWTSYTGYISFVGTCTAATTANVVLGEKGN